MSCFSLQNHRSPCKQPANGIHAIKLALPKQNQPPAHPYKPIYTPPHSLHQHNHGAPACGQSLDETCVHPALHGETTRCPAVGHGAGSGAGSGAGQCGCQGASPAPQLCRGMCPAVLQQMLLGVLVTVGSKVLHGDTYQRGVCMALRQTTTCKRWRAEEISKVQPWLQKPRSQQLHLASDPVLAGSGERLMHRGLDQGLLQHLPQEKYQMSPLPGPVRGSQGMHGTTPAPRAG